MPLPRSLAVAIALAALAPASATAQQPPGPQMLTNIEVEPGGSFEHALVECDAPPPGAADCAVRLVLTVAGQKLLDRQTTIPVNETGIDIKVDTSAARNAVLRKGEHKM